MDEQTFLDRVEELCETAVVDGQLRVKRFKHTNQCCERDTKGQGCRRNLRYCRFEHSTVLVDVCANCRRLFVNGEPALEPQEYNRNNAAYFVRRYLDRHK